MDKQLILRRLDQLSAKYIAREEMVEELAKKRDFYLGFKHGVIDCRTRLANFREWVDRYIEPPEVTEMCPSCGREVTLLWDTERDGYKAYCPYCGARLMLCSACHDDGFACDYDSETDRCRWNPAGERTNENDRK